MITVTAAEFQRHFGRYQDEALTQPVAITRNGRERLVMISVDEYRKLKRRSREVIRVGGFEQRRRGADRGRANGPAPRPPRRRGEIGHVCRFPPLSSVWSSPMRIYGAAKRMRGKRKV